MRIVITGAAGYIGSRLIYKINKTLPEAVIVAIDNFQYANRQSLLPFVEHPEIIIKERDVTDHGSWNNDLISADVVIPLAALVGFPICEKHKSLASNLHVGVIDRMCDTLIYHNPEARVIYLNTNSGYGTVSEGRPCTETTPLKPISHYGKSKAFGEDIVLRRLKNSVSLRLATVFGPSLRMRMDLLVNNFIWRAYKEKCNVLFGAHAMRNYIHIDDVCDAIIFMMVGCEARKEVFNVGSDMLNMSKMELAKTIDKVIPHEIIEAEIGSDPDKRDYIVSSQKIYDMGFKCKRTITEAIVPIWKTCMLLDEPVNGNY